MLYLSRASKGIALLGAFLVLTAYVAIHPTIVVVWEAQAMALVGGFRAYISG